MLARAVALLALLAAGSASAQVSGTVTDAATGESLPGAAVRVVGTTVGAAADLDGRYRIPNVPGGEIRLVASYVGYEPDTVAVTVPSGGLVQDFALSLASVQGQEVVVTAQAEGQLAAINEQLRSNKIVNVVSAARIQELPDANAAEAVGRLPGVAITRSGGEANQVAVRGLAPQYTNVTVNGTQLPATNDNRSTDLNAISPELLAGVEVYKALTPDQEASAIGGSVNFRLRSAPAGRRGDVRVQTGYNDLRGTFGQYKAVGSVSDRFFSERVGALVQLSSERVDRSVDQISGDWRTPNEIIPGIGEPFELEARGLEVDYGTETRERLGGSLFLDYDLPGGRVQLSTFANRLDASGVFRETDYDLAGNDLEFGVRSRDVETTLFSTALTGEHVLPARLGGAEVTWSLSRGVAVDEIPENVRFNFAQQRRAYGDQNLTGIATLDEVPALATLDASQTILNRADLSDERRRERDLSAQADLQVPFLFGDAVSGFVKTGGLVRDKSRLSDVTASEIRFLNTYGRDSLLARFPERQFERAGNGFTIANWIGENPGDVFGTYGLGFAPDLDGLLEVRDRLSDTFRTSFLRNLDDYQADERVAGGYLMAEVNVGPVMVLPGFRYEHTRNEYQAQNGVLTDDFNQIGSVQDTTASQSYGNWFPTLHVRYRATEWFDVRLARTEGILRPSHFQVAPRIRRNDLQLTLNRGNALLRPSLATSYDALVSFSGNRLGLLTLGAYVKEIEGVIYSRQGYAVLDPAGLNLPQETFGFQLSDYNNLDETTLVRGLEMEWQTRFNYLPGPLSGVLLTANLSRIWSRTGYPRTQIVRERIPEFPFTRLTNVDTTIVDRMPTQADWLSNVSLGYDFRGFSGRVSALYQGQILRVPGRDDDERYTADYLRFDVRLQQALSSGASLYLSLNNLSDRPDVVTESTLARLASQEGYGWTGDIGLRYRF